MPLLPGADHATISENIRELMNTGAHPEDQAIAIALHKARESRQSAQSSTKRSVGDVVRDLRTINSGKMPDASKAPVAKPAPAADPDPVEEARIQMATKRNKGLNKDVNLPYEGPK